ncbi:MAG: imidazole glycerol phosphate synthase subunit HisH, partial [Dokdonella sp.]|uniref:imidazole glycerol phosphate synthase subunit HisH n=1 Tax=Dokdonella sp. TaxID=2291710 RepID=UPI0032671635
QAMAGLRTRGLDRVLPTLKQPLLGICLGMQLLFEHSSEASRIDAPDDSSARSTDCLGILSGHVQRLPPSPSWPHMGWNQIVSDRAAHPLLDGLAANDWYYFVHGYAAQADVSTIAYCDHGLRFSAAIARDNVHGTQFHPEKSAVAGRRLLSNFLSLT